MFNEILLAVVQAVTEFFPVSSSGHLALVSDLISQQPSLFFFVFLHLASLLAVIIFVRKEIYEILKFTEDGKKLLVCLIIASIPAALVGFLLKDTNQLTSFYTTFRKTTNQSQLWITDAAQYLYNS